jgi:hypothetical protein
MGGKKKILTAIAAAAAAWCRASGYSFQPSAVRLRCGCGGVEDGNGERTRSFLSSPESELLLDAPILVATFLC